MLHDTSTRVTANMSNVSASQNCVVSEWFKSRPYAASGKFRSGFVGQEVCAYLWKKIIIKNKNLTSGPFGIVEIRLWAYNSYLPHNLNYSYAN